MGRQSLRIVMVLGVLVTLVGGTGIFAAFTDRATTGPTP
jgi:predicted ribosomally synthesized peptide with SipW-like signal peptide